MQINRITAAVLCAARAFTSLPTLAASLQAAARSEAPATVTAAAAQDVVEFGVYLPLRHQAQLETLIGQLHDQNSQQYHQWLQPSDFIKQFDAAMAYLDSGLRL